MEGSRRCTRLLIVGMGRSGTSFLTQFLGECGVHLGEVTKKFEHKVSYDIDYPILEREYGVRKGYPYGELPDEEIRAAPEWHERVQQYVARMDEDAVHVGARYWAYKDPRATVLLSLWKQHFDAYIGVFREAGQVAQSYVARGWVDNERTSLGYWIRFNKSILRLWEQNGGAKPMHMLDYNGDVPAQLERLCTALEIQPTEKARQLFDRCRNHFSAAPSPTDPEVARLYASLQQTRSLLG